MWIFRCGGSSRWYEAFKAGLGLGENLDINQYRSCKLMMIATLRHSWRLQGIVLLHQKSISHSNENIKL